MVLATPKTLSRSVIAGRPAAVEQKAGTAIPDLPHPSAIVDKKLPIISRKLGTNHAFFKEFTSCFLSLGSTD
jgi:hypothetical protein